MLKSAPSSRPDEIITPDDVRGHYDTLNQAVLAGNWPTLKSARGKVIFLMDQRPVGPVYLAGHPSLRGRVLFTNAEPGEPDAAFIERNDGPSADITALVQKGYLVRTRTDADTKEARINDTARRDAMIASGAQILSTDYPARARALAGALRGYASRRRGCSLQSCELASRVQCMIVEMIASHSGRAPPVEAASRNVASGNRGTPSSFRYPAVKCG